MRYLINFSVLAVGLPLALHYFNRYFRAHPQRFLGAPPHIFRNWSQAGRLTFVWVSMILTGVVAVPVGLLGVFAFADADLCAGMTAVAGICHGPIRYAWLSSSGSPF